mmetsp:Transcript_17661/g.50457  ORF Transcript_17661/g.50457 Transcript_17661/m.50457 type:complete len:253 (+) Transcript_17661:4258-5016(+)
MPLLRCCLRAETATALAAAATAETTLAVCGFWLRAWATTRLLTEVEQRFLTAVCRVPFNSEPRAFTSTDRRANLSTSGLTVDVSSDEPFSPNKALPSLASLENGGSKICAWGVEPVDSPPAARNRQRAKRASPAGSSSAFLRRLLEGSSPSSDLRTSASCASTTVLKASTSSSTKAAVLARRAASSDVSSSPSLSEPSSTSLSPSSSLYRPPRLGTTAARKAKARASTAADEAHDGASFNEDRNFVRAAVRT